MTTQKMGTNHKPQEVVFYLSDGTKRLVDVGPLQLIFNSDPSLRFTELVDDIQAAKDVMIQTMNSEDADAWIDDVKRSHASLSMICSVFKLMSWKEVAA